MHRTLMAALTAAVLVGASQPAAAQTPLEVPWEDRFFGGLSFGVEGGSAEISDSRTFTVYGEAGTIETQASFGSDAIIDISGGVRVWRNMGVALSYHAKSTTGTADVQASVPHPIFFDRPRSYSETIDGIDRDETATHLQFGWMFPINDKFDVFAYVGPSFYRLTQEVVASATIAEQGPPYSTVIVQPTIETRKESATGYNLGADATYMFYTRDRLRLGIGGFLRFTGATADIQLSDSAFETDLGGAQFGVGARIRF